MPYLPSDKKGCINATKIPYDVGELTYGLTQMCLDFLATHPTPNFANHAEVIAALECTKLEFYRRALAPYEDKKIQENGDVY